ncbi:MAG: hypothetical protein EOO29_11510, partial [Comamonadaceae bacterium]
MTLSDESLFDALAAESPAAFASTLAPAARPGHFDELRGVLTPQPDAARVTAPAPAPPALHDASLPPPVAGAPAGPEDAAAATATGGGRLASCNAGGAGAGAVTRAASGC